MPATFEDFYDYLKTKRGASPWLSATEKERLLKRWPDAQSRIANIPNEPYEPEYAQTRARWQAVNNDPPASDQIVPPQGSMLQTDVQAGNAPRRTPFSSQQSPDFPSAPGLPQAAVQGGYRDPLAPRSAMDRQVRQAASGGSTRLMKEIEAESDEDFITKVVSGIKRMPSFQNAFAVAVLEQPEEATVEMAKSLGHGAMDGFRLIRWAGAKALGAEEVSPELQRHVDRILGELDKMPVEKAMELTAPYLIAMGVGKGAGKIKGRLAGKRGLPAEAVPEAVPETAPEPKPGVYFESTIDTRTPGATLRELPGDVTPKTEKIPQIQPRQTSIAEGNQIAGKIPGPERVTKKIPSEYEGSHIKIGDPSNQEARFTSEGTLEALPDPAKEARAKFEAAPMSDFYVSFGADPQTMRSLGVTLKKSIKKSGDLRKTLSEMFEAVTYQTRNRIKTPQGKSIVAQAENVWRDTGVRAGKAYDKFKQSKIETMTEAERVHISDVLEGHVSPKSDRITKAASLVSDILADYGAEAERLGMKIRLPDGTYRKFRAVDNYVPRVIKKDILNAMEKDIRQFMKDMNATDLTDLNSADRAVLSNMVESRLALGKMRPETMEALKYLIESGQSASSYDAMMFLNNRVFNEMFIGMGNLERARVLNLPARFYERDVKVWLPRYIRGASKRTAEIKQWGQTGKKTLSPLMDQIEKVSPKEAVIVRDLISILTGQSEIQKAYNSPAKSFFEAAVNFNVLSKIGLGTATIPNITQPLYSLMPKFGVLRSLRGLGDLFTRKGVSHVRKSGAVFEDAMSMLSGTDATGFLSNAVDLSLRANLFTTFNKFNKAWTASATKHWITDLHKIAQKGSKRGIGLLRELGIDHKKPLSEQSILEGSYQLSQDLQLMKNPMSQPLWFNSPKTRPYALFKRFAHGQFSRVVKDAILKELIQYKNPAPVLRLIAGGYIGGEFVRWAKDGLRAFLAGREQPDYEENIWQHALNNLAAAGTMGIFTDLFGHEDVLTTSEAIEEGIGSLTFALDPVIVSTLYDAALEAKRTASYWATQEKYTGDFFEAAIRTSRTLPSRAVRLIGGSLTSPVVERLKTQRMKDAQLNRRYSDARQKILTLYIQGKNEEAAKRQEAWNRVYPEKPIKIKTKDVRSERKRRHRESLKDE